MEKHDLKTPATDQHFPKEGTSFFETVVSTNLKTLILLLGEPDFVSDTRSESVQYEWNRLTTTGKFFTVYDYKLYRTIKETMIIDWHISCANAGDDKEAFEDIKKAYLELDLTDEANKYVGIQNI
jgi:hypothetical protein